MENEVNISDLRQIIRNLITFIVIEGKEYVQEQKKQDYVASYLHMLAKVIHENHIEDKEEQAAFIEDIANDIARYIR